MRTALSWTLWAASPGLPISPAGCRNTPATGQKQSQTYPDGSRVSYEYDQLDRLTGVTDAFGRDTTYEYNPAGELVEQLMPGGTKTKYIYDAISQITELRHIDPSGRVTGSYAYTYDPAGNKTAVSKNAFNEDELEETEEQTFAYDALDRLISVQEAGDEYKNYYYDTLGNRVAIIEQEKEHKEAKYYQYNNLNQLTKQYDHDGDIKYYSYDNRGNLTEMRSEGNVFNTYAFDAANQLNEATNKFGDTTSYTYDGLGNRIQTIIDLNHGAEHNNRPVFPPGPGGPPKFVQELKNKNLGQPSHGGNPKPGWDKQYNRHYMAQHYVVDYTKEYDNLLLSYGEHSQIQRYTYGRDIVSMDFLALDDHDNGWIPPGMETNYKEKWDSLFYLHDDLGTTTKVVVINGKTSAHYNYNEFGRPLGAVKLDPNWSGPDNAIAYTGYTYDHFAELYYAQARYYLPDTGRFISQDPWAGDLAQPGTLNPYPYVLNNPLKYVDPLGLERIGPIDIPDIYSPSNTDNGRGVGSNWSDCDIIDSGNYQTNLMFWQMMFNPTDYRYEGKHGSVWRFDRETGVIVQERKGAKVPLNERFMALGRYLTTYGTPISASPTLQNLKGILSGNKVSGNIKYGPMNPGPLPESICDFAN
ncbi:MAG: RHS repeat-associated core domain-containing protein [Firmicutes bacterium]|nr:RHS repeat-associated core domain-containing protein [Bacillota bacterium]